MHSWRVGTDGAQSEADDGRTDPKAGKLEGKPPPLIFKARWINKSSPTNLEAVQLVKVVFKLKYTGKYGEVRLFVSR